MTASRWPLPLMLTVLDELGSALLSVLQLPLSGSSGAVGRACYELCSLSSNPEIALETMLGVLTGQHLTLSRMASVSTRGLYD